MSSEIAVSVSELSKTYSLGIGGRTTPLAEMVLGRLRHPLSYRGRQRERFDALKGVSFEVYKGEAVGIIGRNGAGKSTLLKILSQITYPTSGSVDLYGRTGSLLEVGTGFHPELTGRENIYLNGAVLGMRKREIDSKLDAIIDFADVTAFLDTPVKRYSSGMRVRLAFAVAAHLNPDILVIDEVLSVGDANFQRKCLAKMEEVASEEGRTVLYVSHNLVSVEYLCPRSILLEDGQVKFDGDTSEAIARYLTGSNTVSAASTVPGEFDLLAAGRPSHFGEPILRRLRIERSDGSVGDTVRMGDEFRLHLEVQGLSAHPDPVLLLWVRSESDRTLFALTTRMKPMRGSDGPRADREQIDIVIPQLPITSGRYWIEAVVRQFDDNEVLDRVPKAAEFLVIPADVHGTGYHMHPRDGLVFVEFDWAVHPASGKGWSTDPVSVDAARGA